MNVRPNTSSSGGTICFGVVVLVIDNALGFMSGNRAVSSSGDCIPYALRHRHGKIVFCNKLVFEVAKRGLEALERACRAITVNTQTIAVCDGR